MITPPKASAETSGMKETVSKAARQRKALTPTVCPTLVWTSLEKAGSVGVAWRTTSPLTEVSGGKEGVTPLGCDLSPNSPQPPSASASATAAQAPGSQAPRPRRLKANDILTHSFTLARPGRG